MPNWSIEMIDWTKRTEMADSNLSTSSAAFDTLCWPKLHGKVKPHKVKKLRIMGERDEHGQFQAVLIEENKNIKIPIASWEPPNYIVGFEGISILYD